MIVNERVTARVILSQVESEDVEIVVSATNTNEPQSENQFSESSLLLKKTLASLDCRSVAEYWLEPDLFASYYGYSGREWSDDDVDPVEDSLKTAGFNNVIVTLLSSTDTVRIK